MFTSGRIAEREQQAHLCRNQRQLTRFSHDCECLRDTEQFGLTAQRAPDRAVAPIWHEQPLRVAWSNQDARGASSALETAVGSLDRLQQPGHLLAQHNRTLESDAGRRYHPAASSPMPDTRETEFMRTRQLERATIAHQTYRTLPIVQPRPKARHDLSLGTTYMHLNQDPTYELAIESSKKSKLATSRRIGRKIDEA